MLIRGSHGYSEAALWFYVALSIVLAIVCAPWEGLDDGIPSRSELRSESGIVEHVKNHRYGVNFRLAGIDKTFDYPSKARGNAIVLDALQSAGQKPVLVYYDPTPRTPWLSDDELYDVWEVTLDQRTVRSIAESAEGWRSDNAIRPWLAGAACLSAVYLVSLALRARRSRLSLRRG